MNAPTLSEDRPICIAVLAIGGQGGGVVSSWLVQLAESQGWRAQSTSVPGVAQRTGATIYYIEIIKPSDREAVLALMPTPGDVDLVVAAEWMEAGRAMQRGLVSPDRTTLIASTHRALSLAEKMLPADGMRDSAPVMAAAKASAKKFLSEDLARIAEENGSVISASLFGAISASGALPFSRDAFEDAIRAGGIGVNSSLKAFGAAHQAIVDGDNADPEQQSMAANDDLNAPSLIGGNAEQQTAYRNLCQRVQNEFPNATQRMLTRGLNRVIDFHDTDYGESYLDEMVRLQTLVSDYRHADRLIETLAKYLASAMAYQDVIRVADLKTRATRFERVRHQAAARQDDIVKLTEFMHPRFEEICGLLPANLGRRAETSRWFEKSLSLFTRGRRVRTDSISGFLMLNAVASLRPRRLKSLRHERERIHIDGWLHRIEHCCRNRRFALAEEIAQCQRLIKGYSDTHERGESKYARIMAMLDDLEEHPDAPDLVALLRKAALSEASEDALEQVSAQIIADDTLATAAAMQR